VQAELIDCHEFAGGRAVEPYTGGLSAPLISTRLSCAASASNLLKTHDAPAIYQNRRLAFQTMPTWSAPALSEPTLGVDLSAQNGAMLCLTCNMHKFCRMPSLNALLVCHCLANPDLGVQPSAHCTN
jgi:hypothetical protein